MKKVVPVPHWSDESEVTTVLSPAARAASPSCAGVPWTPLRAPWGACWRSLASCTAGTDNRSALTAVRVTLSLPTPQNPMTTAEPSGTAEALEGHISVHSIKLKGNGAHTHMAEHAAKLRVNHSTPAAADLLDERLDLVAKAIADKPEAQPRSSCDVSLRTLVTTKHYLALFLCGWVGNTAKEGAVFAVSHLIQELTHSERLVGLVGAANFAALMFGPLFGILSDRFSRRRLVLVSKCVVVQKQLSGPAFYSVLHCFELFLGVFWGS